jgi:hypothetical protein
MGRVRNARPAKRQRASVPTLPNEMLMRILSYDPVPRSTLRMVCRSLYEEYKCQGAWCTGTVKAQYREPRTLFKAPRSSDLVRFFGRQLCDSCFSAEEFRYEEEKFKLASLSGLLPWWCPRYTSPGSVYDEE